MTASPSVCTELKAGVMCQRDPIIVEESESVTAAARLMREQHVGYLIVTQPPNAQGVSST